MRRWSCEPAARSNTSPASSDANWQGTGGRAVGAWRLVFQPVLRVAIACGGAHEKSRRRPVEAHAGRHVHAPAGDAEIALEVHELGIESVVDRALAQVPVTRGEHARRARIGPVLGGQVLVDGLKVLHLPAHIPVFIAIRGFREAFGERHAGAFGAVREILEVAAVADIRGVDAEAPVAGQLGDVLEVYVRVRIDALDVVARQEVEVERAALALS